LKRVPTGRLPQAQARTRASATGRPRRRVERALSFLDLLSPQLRSEIEALVDERIAQALRSQRNGQRFLSVRQAAELYGCSERAIRGRAARGRVVTRRSGRTVLIDVQATERLLEDS